jgi:murein DD-endopeptidase MepM/ murein hydrolase activator NlpD
VIASAVTVLVALGIWHAAPAAHAAQASASAVRRQLGAKQSTVAGLSGTVSAADGHLHQLGSGIASLQRRIDGLQGSLNAERRLLASSQIRAAAARAQLQQLEVRQGRAQLVLARRLVTTYETAQPDIVTVVVEARGFQDMLNRIVFARRIQDEDARVVARVRAARSAVSQQATRLGAIELRRQQLATRMLAQRNGLYRARLRLVQERLIVAQQRSATAGRLSSARQAVAGLQHQLLDLQAGQAAGIQPPARKATPSSPPSSGGFTFPMPRGDVSVPGTWSLDDGVDISAPAHTPELAVGAGTIVQHGIGGFGPWAPVLHLDSGDYVYYGHAGPGNELPIGTHVDAGQVIAEVGAGIVGISSGPHLEIGFCDASGTPLGPQTAPRMMSLLQASY